MTREGSGKTLTSFKTAQLATKVDHIDKVLFVVDRKDLDHQTMIEYDRYEKGCANSNNSTKKLTEQLGNPNAKIIITTIQKLDNFIKKNKKHEVYKKHVVLIFDECHRSQFGDMHTAITKNFKLYHIFGFTGTPIFVKNAPTGNKMLLKTTPQAFGKKLHTYTIVNAINDENVLPFRIDYINTIKEKDDINDSDVISIDREKALEDPKRVSLIVDYIINHFDQKTKRASYYKLKDKRVFGFNSIFTVSSIPMAMRYYEEFKKQTKEKNRPLKVCTIYSYSPNEEESINNLLPDENLDATTLDKTSRNFLDYAIDDYNKTFNMNFSTGVNDFQNYYKDVSKRVKEKDIDILIVVNMFLTGFDATTLNTLWVDKNLKQHGLIQAFSRTNRILNSVKTYGNIVCFRNLQEATRDAIALFGDEDAESIVVLRSFEDYYNGFDKNGKHTLGYVELIELLKSKFPLEEEIIGETKQKEFISLFGNFLKLKNILTSFDEFKDNQILSDRDLQDYQSNYIDIYEKFKRDKKSDKANINDDVVFELELVKQEEINIDYILKLVKEYHDSNCKNSEILVDIQKAIKSSIELRSKKELIESFIDSINTPGEKKDIYDLGWDDYAKSVKEQEVEYLIKKEKLKPKETVNFVDNALKDGYLKTIGTDIDKLLPPMSRFSKGPNNRIQKKTTVIEELKQLFEKFKGLNCFE